MRAQGCTPITQARTFASATHRYWFSIFACARAELRLWRQHAQRIPESTLRIAALDALHTKSDSLEGAVAFAAFVPPSARRDVVRTIAAFEIALDYLDNVVEMPNPDPILNARNLCGALHHLVGPRQSGQDYYKHNAAKDDGGYLQALMNRGRLSFASLPSSSVVADAMHAGLSRLAMYQSLNHGGPDVRGGAFRDWACSHSAPSTGLHWWETAAALGSQLSLLALIAAAGDLRTGRQRVAAIERAYHPWVGALSTLLDSVVDQCADEDEDQQSLVGYYRSPEVAARRLRMIAIEARRAVGQLADAADHIAILAAMAAFFHAQTQASTPEIRTVTQSVLDEVGGWGIPALLMFRLRRSLPPLAQPADKYK